MKVKISENIVINENYVLIDGCIYLQSDLLNKWQVMPSVDLQTKQLLVEEHACDFGFSLAKLQKKLRFWKQNK